MASIKIWLLCRGTEFSCICSVFLIADGEVDTGNSMSFCVNECVIKMVQLCFYTTELWNKTLEFLTLSYPIYVSSYFGRTCHYDWTIKIMVSIWYPKKIYLWLQFHQGNSPQSINYGSGFGVKGCKTKNPALPTQQSDLGIMRHSKRPQPDFCLVVVYTEDWPGDNTGSFLWTGYDPGIVRDIA